MQVIFYTSVKLIATRKFNMSVFHVKSSTLSRLSSLASFFEASTPEDMRKELNTVRLENKGGKTFAIVSNQKIAAIEYVSTTDEPDGAVHLILSEGLLQQLFMEASSDCEMTLNTIPEMGISTMESTSGYNVSNCCHWWEPRWLDKWQTWATEPATETIGIMAWNMNRVESLLKTSPSGNIVFPAFVDTTTPVVFRDYFNPKWVGIMFAQLTEDIKITEPAVLPEWWGV